MYMKKLLKALLLLAAAGAAAFSLLTGCFVPDVEMSAERTEAASGTMDYPQDSWAVYWYHCGSNLESDWGCASGDLKEMLDVRLSENVQVVVQTGGADKWRNTQVDADKLQRYVYNDAGFFLVDEQPKANMGKTETLADFLRFCQEHYPAAHTMVLFWNHGGGSVSGAAFDESYRYDSLTLDEFYDAFGQVYNLSVDNPPLDVIGFDTCLMATIDTAYNFCDVARYLVASEESEPGCGWYYTDWLQALSDNPGMDGARLGKAICDAFQKGCEKEDVADEITLSVTDLMRIGPLMRAYESLGQEALRNAVQDSGFFPAFGRMAARAENYGGNTEDSGYTNMVDLGDLARKSAHLLPESAQAVQDGLADCVVYQIRGPYRKQATGLSCYYSYNADKEDYDGFSGIAACNIFTSLYGYEIEGVLDENGMDYLKSIGYSGRAVPPVRTLKDSGSDYPLSIDEGGNLVLDVGADAAGVLTGVYFRLAYIDGESNTALLLGRDNDIDMDWENGIFRDHFRGVWGALDGNLVYMDVVYEGDDYNLYSVPILLNGEAYSLRVVYDYGSERYEILGARKGLDDNGMADKNLRQLQPGDKVTTVYYLATASGGDAFEAYEADTFPVTADTSFGEVELTGGEFAMLFELTDVQNNTSWSQMAALTIEDGMIYTELVD